MVAVVWRPPVLNVALRSLRQVILHHVIGVPQVKHLVEDLESVIYVPLAPIESTILWLVVNLALANNGLARLGILDLGTNRMICVDPTGVMLINPTSVFNRRSLIRLVVIPITSILVHADVFPDMELETQRLDILTRVYRDSPKKSVVLITHGVSSQRQLSRGRLFSRRMLFCIAMVNSNNDTTYAQRLFSSLTPSMIHDSLTHFLANLVLLLCSLPPFPSPRRFSSHLFSSPSTFHFPNSQLVFLVVTLTPVLYFAVVTVLMVIILLRLERLNVKHVFIIPTSTHHVTSAIRPMDYGFLMLTSECVTLTKNAIPIKHSDRMIALVTSTPNHPMH